jgi:pSer/pThr/pTyr-binding forkhead associated (FHA) protein
MSAAAAASAGGGAGALGPRGRRRAEALPALPPGPRLAVLDDDGGIAIVPLVEGPTAIGRALHAGLRLDDHTVSRRHAVVHRDGDDVVVADERSLNGVTVNGGLVERRRRCDGDRIRLGRVELRFLVGRSPRLP